MTAETVSDCLKCGCPWNSCAVHTEGCCDDCAHLKRYATPEATA